MTMLITWNDRLYDLDPSELSMRQLGRVEDVTGHNYPELIGHLCVLNSTAVRAVTWVQDSPDLDFGTYDGPPARLVFPHLPAMKALVEEMGKALSLGEPETNGSLGLPTASASAAPSSTTSPPPTSPST